MSKQPTVRNREVKAQIAQSATPLGGAAGFMTKPKSVPVAPSSGRVITAH